MDVKEFRKRTWHTFDKHSDEEVQRILNFFYGVCKYYWGKDMKEIREKIQNAEENKEIS